MVVSHLFKLAIALSDYYWNRDRRNLAQLTHDHCNVFAWGQVVLEVDEGKVLLLMPVLQEWPVLLSGVRGVRE